jgi:hypothetical protein
MGSRDGSFSSMGTWEISSCISHGIKIFLLL